MSCTELKKVPEGDFFKAVFMSYFAPASMQSMSAAGQHECGGFKVELGVKHQH